MFPAMTCIDDGAAPTDGTIVLRRMARGTASSCISEHMDLLDLLKRAEGKTLEFKRDLSAPEVR